MMNQDGVYDHSKGRGIVSEDPEPSLLRYDYMGPFANAQEAFMARALKSVTMPAATSVFGRTLRYLPSVDPSVSPPLSERVSLVAILCLLRPMLITHVFIH